MIIQNKIIIYDTETISKFPETTQICELSAIVIDPRTLQPIEDGIFNSLLKPTDFSLIEDAALEVNHITRDELENAPNTEQVFKDFVQFVQKYKSKGRAPWNLPIPAGMNIVNFDNIIIKRYCEMYKTGPIFHPTQVFDLLHIHHIFFENQPNPEKYNMDFLRSFYGLSDNGAHRALKDCEDTMLILQRFLGFTRRITEKNKDKFKGAFNESA